jgi:very-long-chain (3R)-3-hydroxyacyl-CoA dehydratase
LGLTIKTALRWKNLDDLFEAKYLYANTNLALKTFLSTAFLEVFHAIFKIVPSKPVIVFIQVLARFLIIFGFADYFEVVLFKNFILFYLLKMFIHFIKFNHKSRNSIAILLLNTCWSTSEITRYLYYLLNIDNKGPFILTWCRYTFFIPLYPIGAFGEFLCVRYASLFIEPIKIRSQYSLSLPNKFNFSIDLYYLFWTCMFIYPPGLK